MRTVCLGGAKVPGVSHTCNTVESEVSLLVSSKQMSTDSVSRVDIKTHEKLIIDLVEMTNSLPETVTGIRAGQKALVNHVKKHLQDKGRRVMTRIPNPSNETLLQEVKKHRNMCVTSVLLSARFLPRIRTHLNIRLRPRWFVRWAYGTSAWIKLLPVRGTRAQNGDF